MLDDSEKILEYAEQVSLQLKDIFVSGELDKTKLLDALGTMGRIVSRAYAINHKLVKEQQAQIDEYEKDLKRKFDEHDCANDDGCAICEEYYYSKGWDGLAHFAGRKGKDDSINA